jgi:hypothetical protein
VVRVAEGAEGGNDAATQEFSSENLSSPGGITPLAAYGGLGVGVLALILALVALLRRSK